MKLLLTIFLLILNGCSLFQVNSLSDANIFRCDYLIGRWTGSFSSEKWNYSSVYISEYLPQGIYRGYFTMVGNEDLKYAQTQELRTWFCDGKTFGTFLVATSDDISHKVYQIIELTKKYRKYRTVIGNEVGKVYESYKLPEP